MNNNQALLKPHMDILGVDWGAPAEAVKRAFRAAVKSAHPDVAGPGSHERMARINAAYDILKNGVPSQQSVPKPHFKLRHTRMSVGDNIYDHWTEIAKLHLAAKGIHRVKPSRFGRLLGRKTSLHIPVTIEIFGGMIEITVDSTSIPKGTNYFLVPELTPNGDTLSGTGRTAVIPFNCTENGAIFRMERAPSLDARVLPRHRGLKVFLSTSP